MNREELRAELYKRGFFLLFGWRSRVWSRFLATLSWRQDFLLSFVSKRFLLAFRSVKVWWRSRSFWSHTLTQDLIFVARTLLLQDWFFQEFVLIGTWFQQKIVLNVGLKLGLWTIFVDCLLAPTNSVFKGYWIFQKQLPFEYWGKRQNLRKFVVKIFCNSSWKGFVGNVGASLIKVRICYLRFTQTWKLFEGRTIRRAPQVHKWKSWTMEVYQFCFKHIDDFLFTQRAFSTLVDCTS